MSEYTPPKSEEEFSDNFSQIKPLMTDTEAHYESSRCLFCYDAPCVNACPTGIDIPLFIRQINSKNEIGAAKTIYDSNIFGYACGKVCPTEVLCEGACVYNDSDVKAIEIGRLQSFATGKMIRSKRKLFMPGKSNGKKVAVIGAGPAGISCACELRMMGFDVDVFESKSLPSGLLIHGVAPYKITNEEVLDELNYLQEQFGFHIAYGKPVADNKDLSVLEGNYDAIFIGFGLGKTSMLKIKGEDFDNVLGAVEFTEQLRIQHHKVVVPEKVIVLGGGNTAMDAAGEAARMGAEVILAYRRSKEEMPAYDFEYDLAKNSGVKAIFNVSPLEITGENGKATGVILKSTIDGKEQAFSCDWIIKATGQSKQTELVKLAGISTDERGRIIVNEKFQTSSKKFFAAGDAVSGGQEVVNAVAGGKKAAWGIKEFLI